MKKRGISNAILIVLMILLVLAAFAIVWEIVMNLFGKSEFEIQSRQKCVMADIDFDLMELYEGGVNMGDAIRIRLLNINYADNVYVHGFDEDGPIGETARKAGSLSSGEVSTTLQYNGILDAEYIIFTLILEGGNGEEYACPEIRKYVEQNI